MRSLKETNSRYGSTKAGAVQHSCKAKISPKNCTEILYLFLLCSTNDSNVAFYQHQHDTFTLNVIHPFIVKIQKQSSKCDHLQGKQKLMRPEDSSCQGPLQMKVAKYCETMCSATQQCKYRVHFIAFCHSRTDVRKVFLQ